VCREDFLRLHIIAQIFRDEGTELSPDKGGTWITTKDRVEECQGRINACVRRSA